MPTNNYVYIGLGEQDIRGNFFSLWCMEKIIFDKKRNLVFHNVTCANSMNKWKAFTILFHFISRIKLKSHSPADNV